MKRWLIVAAYVLGLGACDATETGNPDPSHDLDSGEGPPSSDGGAPPADAGLEPPPPFDAGVSEPPGQDAGPPYDAGDVNDEDAGDETDDGGT